MDNTGTLNQQTVNMEQLKESYKVVLAALDKACSSGSFSLSEAYIIKISISNLEKGIKQLEEKSRV